MISQEQLQIETTTFACYQAIIENQKSIEKGIVENILLNHNNHTISKEDDL
jgi:hypothetical protein